jgi:hypothetical protein
VVFGIGQPPDKAFDAFVSISFALRGVRVVGLSLFPGVWADTDMIAHEGFSPHIAFSTGIRLSGCLSSSKVCQSI